MRVNSIFNFPSTHEKVWALCSSFIVVFFLALVFLIHVQFSYEGKIWGPLLPGSLFGTPNFAKDLGIYTTSPVGWDAQFYYYQSNDPLGITDVPRHVDDPSYRYQRIGVPLMAFTVARVLGFEQTPPAIYYFVLFAWVWFGLFLLMRILIRSGLNPILALAWPISLGVLNALFHGMPDPVGDALLIVVLWQLLKRNLVSYSVFATFLVFVREGYLVFAFAVFCVTFFKKVEWNKSYFKSIVGTAIPGILFIFWFLYVTRHFGISPIESVKGTNLTDYPLLGLFKTYSGANEFERRAKVISFIIIVSSIFICIRNIKMKNVVGYISLPYIVLTACLGTTVWFDYSGHMKAIGSLIVILLFLLRQSTHVVLKAFLLIIPIWSLISWWDINSAQLFSRWEGIVTVPKGAETINGPLKGFSSKIYLLGDVGKLNEKSGGPLGSYSRRSVNLDFEVENTSSETWRQFPTFGNYSLVLGYAWFDLNNKLIFSSGQTPLSKDVAPGQRVKITLPVYVPVEPGKYLLKVSMLQNFVAWFYDVAKDNSLEIPVDVSQ